MRGEEGKLIELLASSTRHMREKCDTTIEVGYNPTNILLMSIRSHMGHHTLGAESSDVSPQSTSETAAIHHTRHTIAFVLPMASLLASEAGSNKQPSAPPSSLA